MSTVGSLPGGPSLGLGPRLRSGSWLAFGVFAVYGTLRWDTMLPGADQPHVLGALPLAGLSAVVLRLLGPRRWMIALLVVVDLCAVLVIAGFPLGWITGLHWSRIAGQLSNGLAAIPNVLVPYRGDDPATAAVLALGAGLLLLCAGLMFGLVRDRPATGPLALVAMPLIVLAIVPSTIVAPHFVYLHGLLSFAMVVCLVLGPRMYERQGGAALALVLVAAVLGGVAVGVVEGDTPWVHAADGPLGSGPAGAGLGTGTGIQRFAWRQGYGSLGVQSDETVLSVTARRPAYWKAEDLDRFDGSGWTAGAGAAGGLSGVSAAHLARYSEQINVVDDEMSSAQVIAAGYARRPDSIGTAPGTNPGTWTTRFALTPGDQYDVRVYAPDPSVASLMATPRTYPAALAPLRTLSLPGHAYAPVEALAARWSRGTRTPIGYVEALLNDLSPANGYVYTLDPPRGGRYPLISFLLGSHRGYCQQFAGAMALLLRMRGIPARVAVGFSPGRRRAHSDTYDVAADDAHAWVEVWFPAYGWVTFDPTPEAPLSAVTDTPAGTGDALDPGAQASESAHQAIGRAARRRSGRGPTGLRQSPGGAGAVSHRGGAPLGAIVLAALALAGLLALTRWVSRRGYTRRATVAELIAELDDAFALCGRRIGPGDTLEALGRGLADPEAAGYLCALADHRYGREAALPTARGRAALRRELAAGQGSLGRIRSLWALPPRRAPQSRAVDSKGWTPTAGTRSSTTSSGGAASSSSTDTTIRR